MRDRTPTDYGIEDDVPPEIAQAMIALIEQGLVVDSGQRRWIKGKERIVWVAAEHAPRD